MNDMQLGKAGEYLVCFDLIKRGFTAYPSEQGLPYDIILDTGKDIFKVQVKATREPYKVPQRKNITRKYLFHVNRCGKNEKKEYAKNDVDIFALVGIDKMVIGYLPSEKTKKTMFFLPEGEIPVKSAQEDKEKIKKLFEQGLSLKNVSLLSGKAKSYCIRVRKGQEEKNFNVSYLSDYTLEDCLQCLQKKK